MRRSIKALILILVVALCFTIIISGCSSKRQDTTVKGESKVGNETQQKDSNGTTEDDTERDEAPVEISYMTVGDMANNNSYVVKKLPELLKDKGFNVRFNMVEVGSTNASEWSDKLKLMIASGETPPDLMQFSDIYEEAKMAGWFANIPVDILKKNMPRYYEQAKKVYDKMWATVKDINTGEILAIPSYNTYGPCRHTFAYRGDWLKKFGMDPPRNLEEFEVWLRKCRDEDPDGDGNDDTFGYTAEDSWKPPFAEIFAAYGSMPFYWMDVDGRLIRGEVMPEAKQALEILRKWYSEGLLPKGIMTTSKIKADWFSGMVGTYSIAYAPYLIPGGKTDVETKKIAEGAKVLAAPPPKGPTGKWGTTQSGPKKYVLLFGKHLEKDLDKMSYIMRLFETIALDKDLYQLATLGEKGIHWEFTNKQADKGSISFIPPYDDHQKRVVEVGIKEVSESALCPIWFEEVYQDYLDPTAIEYSKHNHGYYDVMVGQYAEGFSQVDDELKVLTKATFLEIINGTKPLEYFDEFVQQWYDKGGHEMTEANQKIYDKIFKD